MPSVDPTSFARVEVTATTTSSGHRKRSNTGRNEVPSAATASSTKPPTSDLGADHEHRRATSASSAKLRGSSSSALTAVTNAAKPDADDAKPAAVGNEFLLCTVA